MNSSLAIRTAIRLSCLISSILVWGSTAIAQVAVSPLITELQASRGQTRGTITVRNPTNQAFRARVYTQAFTYNRQGFQALKNSPNDLKSYLQFSPRELVVPPGTERRIRFFVSLPPSIPDGEYRTAIFTENLIPQTTNQGVNTINVSTRIGSLVYVRKGNASPKLAVDSAAWDSSRKKIKLLVRNSGKASTLAIAKYTLKQGNTVIQKGSSDETTVIDGNERDLLLSNSDKNETDLATGNYQLTGDLVWSEGKNKTPFSVNVVVTKN